MDGYETELIEAMAEHFSDDLFTIEVAATGGGCDWLVVQQKGDPFYYACTDGDAGIPAPGEGFGFVGRFHTADDHPDWEGWPLYSSADTISLDIAAAIIKTDLANRAQWGAPARNLSAQLHLHVHGSDDRPAEDIFAEVDKLIGDALNNYRTSGILHRLDPEPTSE